MLAGMLSAGVYIKLEVCNMNNYEKSFTKPIIRYGSFTNLIAIPLCFVPAIYLWVAKGAFLRLE